MTLRLSVIPLVFVLAACGADGARLVATAPAAQAPALASLVNFRDVGAKPTADGGCIKAGLVYRSGMFDDALVEDGRDMANVLGVRAYYDLRGLSEGAEPPALTQAGVAIEHLPLDSRDDPFLRLHHPDAAAWGAFYLRTLERHGAMLSRLYAAVAHSESPVVFGCTLGKDRTGIAAALLLGAMGVSREVIVADYAASTHHLLPRASTFAPVWARLGMTRDDFERDYLTADPEAMRIFLESIEQRHGSVAAALGEAGVDAPTLELLRRRLYDANCAAPTHVLTARPKVAAHSD